MGVLNGVVRPADVVAIVGVGPIGLAAILTAQVLQPQLIAGGIYMKDWRLQQANKFGADTMVNSDP